MKLREAAVTMAATLAAFATALAVEHAARLSTSIVILAVALALSIGRRGQQGGRRSARGLALAAVALAGVAVGANEIGTRIFSQPDLGDAMFVVAMSTTIWVRRFGPIARQIATFATFPLVAMLIVPAPSVTTSGSTADGRWWSALIAVVALGWVTVIRLVAERVGVLPGAADQPPPISPLASPARSGRRIASGTRMALQMAAALGAAFALGRSLFGMHWAWVVLTAFIVCGANRGRGDVVHKAAMRLVGAGVGTLAATTLSGAFPPGDAWSIVVIFAVLAVALWLRQVNYAYWAAGMTAALALLYGYYGERGVGLLGTRLEAILVGAALAVAASWLVLPVRTADIVRRDLAAALLALDRYLASIAEDPTSAAAHQDRFRRAVSALEHVGTLLRAVPTRLQPRFDYLPALRALERCATDLSAVTVALADRRHELHSVHDVRAQVGQLRQANARRLPPDPLAWNRLADAVGALPGTFDPPTPPSPPPVQDRLWTSSEKVLAYANRLHATTYQLLSEIAREGTVVTYLVEDPTGRQAQLAWSRDASEVNLPEGPGSQPSRAENTAGRTPSGYPYRIAPQQTPSRSLGIRSD